MSLLGDLFDPVGAAVTGGNNNTFDSVFSPMDNTFGDQGLGFLPGWEQDMNNSYAQPIGNFADNTMDAGEDELKNLGNHFKSNPLQMLYSGADPASTSIWNKATNQNNTSFLNQYGGETNQDFQNSANRGINTEDGQLTGAIANMVAGAYGGSALGGLGSTAYGSVFPAAGSEAGVAGSSGIGGMGSSALDVQAELAAPAGVAGSGSSAAGYSASEIPGWASSTTGAAGAAGNVARGTTQGAANALDNNQNPFVGAARGGLQAGIGSNLDYASGLGVDNPLYKAGINGAISGGARTAMSGDTSDTGYGALVGALGGLANKAGSYFSTPSGGSSGGMGGAGGTTNWGNLAAGLGNLYMSSRNNAGIQSQINGLNSLYAPNSPYAQQLQQSLQRQDAASGRGSQYGTRAVELQAQLANAASRNAPTLSNLYQQQRQNRFSQLAGLFAMGKNSGAFGGSQQPGLNYDTSAGAGYGSIPGGSGISGFQGNNPSAYQGSSPGMMDPGAANQYDPNYFGGP